ncbi:hypothetical protein [Ureibacillus chungkukjangi]|uniref:hypothetical protein n=1 Tax=Ureibacillus chungkukjangi TaxID=1202712 RepID=UPI00203C6242|nr:hypothetical protein [Ureibacillus chungkukjangi]
MDSFLLIQDTVHSSKTLEQLLKNLPRLSNTVIPEKKPATIGYLTPTAAGF